VLDLALAHRDADAAALADLDPGVAGAQLTRHAEHVLDDLLELFSAVGSPCGRRCVIV
jgi:hypothetical protein